MAEFISTPRELPTGSRPAGRIAPAIAITGVALGALILLGTLLLWFHYGTTVFFEMIATGIAGCF